MYWDLLLIINLAVNYFLLLVTARLFRKQPGAPRLLGGAAAGALAVLLLQLPPYPVVTAAATVITPILMVVLVFWPLRWLELFLIWCSLFFVSFMIGGAVLALSLFNCSGNTWESPRGAASLMVICFVIYIGLSIVRPYLEDRKWQKLWQLNLLVSWQGKEKAVRAYLDSGNRLRDPFSQRAVIVVHYRSLEGLLPPDIFRCLSNPKLEPWSVLPDLGKSVEARSFTLVPFSGLGARGEILLGFKPDAITISRGERTWRIQSPVVLGLSRRGFSPVAEYEALLPPDLLEEGGEGRTKDTEYRIQEKSKVVAGSIR